MCHEFLLWNNPRSDQTLQAFTILFAYIIQEFYYEVVINNAYTKDEKTSTGFKATEELAIRVSWFAIVMALCPLMVRSARGSNPPGVLPPLHSAESESTSVYLFHLSLLTHHTVSV